MSKKNNWSYSKWSRPTSDQPDRDELMPGNYWLLDDDVPIGADSLLIHSASYERRPFGDVPEGFATAGFIIRARLARGGYITRSGVFQRSFSRIDLFGRITVN